MRFGVRMIGSGSWERARYNALDPFIPIVFLLHELTPILTSGGRRMVPIHVTTTHTAATFANEPFGLSRTDEQIRQGTTPIWLHVHHPFERWPRLAW